MKNVDHAQSVMSMIMPRMEIKKVNHAQENFKETFDRGRKELPRIEKNASGRKMARKTEIRSEQQPSERMNENVKSKASDKSRGSQEQLSEKEAQSLGKQSEVSENEVSASAELKQKPSVKKEEEKLQDETVSVQDQSQAVEENPLQVLLQLKQEYLSENMEDIVSEGDLQLADTSENEKVVLNLPKESSPKVQTEDVFNETEKADFESIEPSKWNIKNLPKDLSNLKEEGRVQTPEKTSAVFGEILVKQDEEVLVGQNSAELFEQYSSEPELADEVNTTSLFAAHPEVRKEEKGILKESIEKNRPEQEIVQPLKVTIRQELDMLKNQNLGQNASEEENADFQKESELSEMKEEVRFIVNELKTSALSRMVDRNQSIGTQRTNFDLVSRVMDEVKISLGQNKTQMQIKLYPETLGKLTIKLSSENGVMNASFFAENDKAKLIIESQMAELRKILESQGIQVQNLTVTVDHGHEELARHKNLMEAQKYSKIKGLESQADIVSEEVVFKNPYIIEDEFTERI